MSYKKVYYEDIWNFTSDSSVKCQDWKGKYEVLYKAFEPFSTEGKFTGEAAESIKNYITEVHSTLLGSIDSVLGVYIAKAGEYYNGYKTTIDVGEGLTRYTTFVFDELNPNGSIKSKLKNIEGQANSVAADANRVKYSISHLLTMYSGPNLTNLQTQLGSAIDKVQKLNEKIINYETARKNDFSTIDSLIEQIERIIDYQLGKSRVPVVKYQSGQVGTMCDFQKLYDANEEATKQLEEFLNSENYEDIMQLMFNKDELIKEENEKERGWIRWVAIGVAIGGSIILTVVTAGGAAPLTCAIVGGVVGGGTVAASKFADNYVDNGNFTDGMDWSKFGKEVLVGTVTGAVGGCFGGMTQGSAIKQPFENAVMGVARGMSTQVAGDATDTLWDVGEAIISGKPGDEVFSIFSDGIQEIGENAFANGIGDFASGYLEGKFGINTGDKSYLHRAGEKFITNIVEDGGEEIVKSLFDVGDAFVNGGDVNSVLNDSGKKVVNKIGESAGDAVIGEAFNTKGFKNILKDNKTASIFKDSISAGITKGTGQVIGGVSERSYEAITGEGSVSDILDKNKIIEDDLNHGMDVAKEMGKSGAKTAMKDTSFTSDMKKISYEKNGKQMVDIVDFGEGKPKIIKQDYDAARRVAGEGAYSDMKTKEILGLSSDTNLKDAKFRSVSYDRIEKDSSQKGDTQATYIKMTNKTTNKH